MFTKSVALVLGATFVFGLTQNSQCMDGQSLDTANQQVRNHKNAGYIPDLSEFIEKDPENPNLFDSEDNNSDEFNPQQRLAEQFPANLNEKKVSFDFTNSAAKEPNLSQYRIQRTNSVATAFNKAAIEQPK